MKKLWILFAIAVVLFFMRFREGFEATENIKDPATWTDAEIDRIKSMTDPKSTEENAIVRSIVGGFWPIWKQETLRVTLNDVTTYLDGNDYIKQTPSKRNEYIEMLKEYYITQGQSLFTGARGYDANDFSSYLSRSSSSTESGKVKKPSTSDTQTIESVSTYLGIPRNAVDKINYYINKLVDFYDKFYMPNKRIPTLSEIKKYTDDNLPNIDGRPDTNKSGFINLIDYWFTSNETKESGTSSSASNVDPVCPADRTINSTKTECDLETELCGPGFEATSDQKCKSINGNQIQDNIGCEPGTTFNPTSKKCKSRSVPPTCPDNYTFQRVDNKGTCKSNTTQTSNTTGGSSGNLFGGVSGGPSQGDKSIFGPLFNGTGSNIVGNTSDSSKTNAYPKLMGGTSGFANTGRSDTARMMLPIQESKFPGDLDFIPDPYRVSLTYNASSYSSGREPIPFLTDFSAFQK